MSENVEKRGRDEEESKTRNTAQRVLPQPCTLCCDAQDWVLDNGYAWHEKVYFGTPCHVPGVVLCSTCRVLNVLEGSKERGDAVFQEWVGMRANAALKLGPEFESIEGMVERAMGTRPCDRGTKNTSALTALAAGIQRKGVIDEYAFCKALQDIPGVLTASQAEMLWPLLKNHVDYLDWVLMNHTADQWNYRNIGDHDHERRVRIEMMCYKHMDVARAFGPRVLLRFKEMRAENPVPRRTEVLRMLCFSMAGRLQDEIRIEAFERLKDTLLSADHRMPSRREMIDMIKTCGGDGMTHRYGPAPTQFWVLSQLVRRLRALQRWERIQMRVFTFNRMLRRLRACYEDFVERSYAPGGAHAQAALARLGETAPALDAM